MTAVEEAQAKIDEWREKQNGKGKQNAGIVCYRRNHYKNIEGRRSEDFIEEKASEQALQEI